MPELMSPAAALRLALTTYLPDGYRDEDGAWHDGPVLRDALAALDALLDEIADLRGSLSMLRDAWNAHMETCKQHADLPVLPAPSWDDLERWRNAPSDTASGGASA